ncbi:SLC13 family permease [Faunimonas sp. B44]|uniref:SLC13 family permease n=1 Tax=Faunimonas sp. B44 TaxID=3461493 RepID=UPI004043EEC3
MSTAQILILVILAATVAMFLWGRWRHDMVALGALLACVLAGLVEPGEAFAGFGHPAVITVACVLVLSQGLQNSGAVDAIARRVLRKEAGPTLSLAALVGLGAAMSGFMNNVGAMALLMPVAVQLARRLDLPPGRVLMPLAFGTILGGMTTLIGTPPNLIVAAFRARTGVAGFGMFDFTPVGLAVAVAGIAFIVLIGWRLVPATRKQADGDFEAGAYFTEARVPEKSRAVGMTLREIEDAIGDSRAQIVGLVRNEVRMIAPHGGRQVAAGDIVVLEAEAAALPEVLSALDLKLEEERETPAAVAAAGELAADPAEPESATAPVGNGEKKAGDAKEARNAASEEIVLRELVVLPRADIVGRSATDMRLRTRYGLNLLAVSRKGVRVRTRLRTLRIAAGDLLLMQGPPEALAEFAAEMGCVPLAERALRIPDPRKALIASLIMAGAVGGAALGLVPAAISFAMGALASMAFGTVPPRRVYDAIDWSVVVLLGALIPVAGAMETTGAAGLVARFLLDTVVQGHAVAGLTLILVVTMFLSDVMNNAATAAVMCPIAIGTAAALGVNADSFLMAVAVGASCAFLTPIGHQNNTLILGPGGFRFGDYWQLGLPLEIVVVVVSVPLLLLVWPL